MSLIIKINEIKSTSHLQAAVPYILKEEKTKGLTYSNAGRTAEEILDCFALTKNTYPSRGSREAYHLKFSFSKDETLAPETALHFIEDWAEKFLHGQYDFALSVHQDRDHLHMHLIFNATCRTGKKFHYGAHDWDNVIKPLTNRLAEKYHTGYLKEKDETLDYSADYRKTKDVKSGVSWQRQVESDIDACITRSKSYADFKARMVRDFSYTLREGVSQEHGVYLSLTPPGKAKAIRSYHLSAGYAPPDIEKKIEKKKAKSEPKPSAPSDSLIDSIVFFDSNDYSNTRSYPKNEQKNKGKSTDGWIIIHNQAFIPYKDLTSMQKAMVKKSMDAKRLYQKTGTSKLMHEQSVSAMRKLNGQTKTLGTYKKNAYKQSLTTKSINSWAQKASRATRKEND